MIKEKQFDCVKFKNELQENLMKSSGTRDFRKYVIYVNKIAQNSQLHKIK
jgi:hypothetical protein